MPPVVPHQFGHISAPIGGLNTISSGVDMPASDSIFSYNLIGGEYGLRTRLGSREYVTGLDGDPRSILSFTGSTKDGANNRMFACTQTGIWDCSASTSSPTQVVTFGTQNADSGYGSFFVFANSAGHFGCYFDEANGYYVYTESGASWAKIAKGAGGTQVQEKQGQSYPSLDPANLVYGTVWKNRIFAVERDTGRGWYLGVGALYGDANPVYFGNRFVRGGDLRCLASWTGDGGAGIDDRLVAVSGGGDVLIYEGTDPSQASTFDLKGVWQLDAVPAGRRLTTDAGGDLAVMSSKGILPLSKLVIGNIIYDRSQYSTYKIGNLFNQLQAATSGLRGWGMRFHPLDSSLVVLVPTAVNQAAQALVMSLFTKGWHVYRDMPLGQCAESWGGTFYFGSGDGSGRILANDGYVDGVTLANPNSYTPINWSLLTAASNLGDPRQKQIHNIVVRTLSKGGGVRANAEGRFGFDMREAAAPASAVQQGTNTWGHALWGQAKWAGAYQPQRFVFGSVGLASELAVAVRGSSTSRMTLTGIDVEYSAGGLL